MRVITRARRSYGFAGERARAHAAETRRTTLRFAKQTEDDEHRVEDARSFARRFSFNS